MEHFAEKNTTFRLLTTYAITKILSSDVGQGPEMVQAPDFGNAFKTIERAWRLVPQSHFCFLDSVWLASQKTVPKLCIE